jgi:hypothetical protein
MLGAYRKNSRLFLGFTALFSITGDCERMEHDSLLLFFLIQK